MHESKITNNLVAFIDILGFSNRALSVETVSELKKLETDIRYIQSEFEFEPQGSRAQVHSELNKEVLAFSDCVVVSLSVDSPIARLQGVFDTWLGELNLFAYSQWTCVHRNTFLRGGVAHGWWYYNENRLVSSAMVKSYQLEKRVNAPIIALTDDLYKLLSESKARSCYSKSADPIDYLFRRYVNPETKEQFWFLDYISICVNDMDWQIDDEIRLKYKNTPIGGRAAVMGEGWQANVTRGLKHHGEVIVEGYNSSLNERDKDKYKWLANYQNEVIEEYGHLFNECRVDL